MSLAYYNEHDPFAAQWLRNLIDAGHIAPGEVDERTIEDVRPGELAGFTQCHFFAGIGVWSYALRLAGWPDDRSVWTGSCPCQPFSQAGKGGGFADERHLWPAWFHLIEVCRPGTVFGEQVADRDGLAWLDLVHSDMEGAGYTFAALDLCGAGFGSPDRRQRLFFVADAARKRHDGPEDRGTARSAIGAGEGEPPQGGRPSGAIEPERDLATRLVGDAAGPRRQGSEDRGLALRSQLATLERASGDAGLVADATDVGRGKEREDDRGIVIGDQSQGGTSRPLPSGTDHRPGSTNGFWRDPDWIFCRDGKWRPVEPGTFPLAARSAGRVGRLRAYGNAIKPQVASAFVEAVMSAIGAEQLEAAE